jgi:hypothetical protein
MATPPAAPTEVIPRRTTRRLLLSRRVTGTSPEADSPTDERIAPRLSHGRSNSTGITLLGTSTAGHSCECSGARRSSSAVKRCILRRPEVAHCASVERRTRVGNRQGDPHLRSRGFVSSRCHNSDHGSEWPTSVTTASQTTLGLELSIRDP